MERAFAGFEALPPPNGDARHWTEVLGVGRSASQDDIERSYRHRALNLHPDLGGSSEAMAELNAAVVQARNAGPIHGERS